MKSLRLLLCVPLLVLLATPAKASPITINFEGEWLFHDFEWKFVGCQVLPEQCAFVQGLAAIGVNEFSKIYFSLTLDSQTGWANPSGVYTGPASGQVRLGSASYSLHQTSFSLSTGQSCGGGNCGGMNVLGGGLAGPALFGYGLTMLPSYFQLTSSGPSLGSASLSSQSLANIASWSTFMTVGFTPAGVGGLHLGHVNLHVTSVSVPEPSTLVLMSGALIAGLVCLRRRRTTVTRAPQP